MHVTCIEYDCPRHRQGPTKNAATLSWAGTSVPSQWVTLPVTSFPGIFRLADPSGLTRGTQPAVGEGVMGAAVAAAAFFSALASFFVIGAAASGAGSAAGASVAAAGASEAAAF